MSVTLGLLLLRVALGGFMFGHGTQKLFGWFGGRGFAVTRAHFDHQLRLRPAGFWTLVGAGSEAGGGLLFAFGLFEPLGAVGIVAAMLMAMILVTRKHGFWAMTGGIESGLLFLVPALAETLTGPGPASLDVALGIALPTPATLLGGLMLTAIGIATALATRAPAAQTTAAATT
jgi:putative oxidoreductase